MRFPERIRIEAALLQELKAVGEDHPRFIYQRLARYFPQMESEDMLVRTRSGRSKWRVRVQGAKRALMERGELAAVNGRWAITEKGRQRAEAEDMPIQMVLLLAREEEDPPGRSIERPYGRAGFVECALEAGAWQRT